MRRHATLWLTVLLALPGAAGAQDDAPPGAKPEEAPAPSVDPQVRAFLDAWGKAMEGIRSLRVEFTQTKTMRILRRPLVSKGRTLLKGKRTLMVVDGKDGRRETELLVVPGEARLHHLRLKRLEVFQLSADAPPPSPFPQFGADLEALPATYHLSLAKEGDDQVLTLIPRAEDTPIKRTRMRFDAEFTIRQVDQLSRKGDALELQVTRFEKNPDLEDADLELHVPEGTKVVQVLGKSKPDD